ncbi:MAG: HlyD family type I secretion periplasmic adaptor subunit [Magnetococcales bacterium]|nr:HlyD family type I secretion periplasmic adaptor subunit [Magnetococcales bacterium]
MTFFWEHNDSTRRPDRSPQEPLPWKKTVYMVPLWFITVVAIGTWAATGQLDIVSVVEGEVVPQGQIRRVQHLEGGIVKEILVQEGARIAENQPLVVLESIARSADVDELKIRNAALQITKIRLQGEVSRKEHLAFPDSLLREHGDLTEEAIQLFQARREHLQSTIEAQRKLAKQHHKERDEVNARLEYGRKNLTLLNEQTKISENLVHDKLMDRYSHLALLRERVSVNGLIQENEAAGQRVDAALEEVEERIKMLTNGFEEEVRKELSETVRDLEELQHRATKLEDSYHRAVLLAPVAGIVKAIHVHSVREVIKPGSDVVEIVPALSALLIEGRLQPKDVGFIHVGQSATIQLASSEAVRFGKMTGTVIFVSPDTIQNQEKVYYRVRIQPHAKAFQQGDWCYDLIAGIQVVSSIHIGQRTLLAYLLEPFMSQMRFSFQEP